MVLSVGPSNNTALMVFTACVHIFLSVGSVLWKENNLRVTKVIELYISTKFMYDRPTVLTI